MEVKYSCRNDLLTMSFFPQASERVDPISKAKLGGRTCRFYLPKDWTVSSVHPDVMALAAALLVYPFAGSTIKVPVGV